MEGARGKRRNWKGDTPDRGEEKGELPAKRRDGGDPKEGDGRTTITPEEHRRGRQDGTEKD